MPRIVTRGSLPATPWKNGGGVTRQIASFPPGSQIDDFDWRISTATVSQSGDFSLFDGIDRRLYVLEGAGLDLRLGKQDTRRLRPGEHVDFRGELAVHGSLVDGPVTDLNIMVRRQRQRVHFADVVIAGMAALDLPWETAALFVQRGRLAVAQGSSAGPFDTIICDPGHPPVITVSGSAELLLIGFDPLA